MLIHIGAGYLVREDDIIGYFDIDGKVDSDVTKDFLKKAEKMGRCDTAGTDLPRSFVLAVPRVRGNKTAHLSADGEKVIFTHISTQALKKR